MECNVSSKIQVQIVENYLYACIAEWEKLPNEKRYALPNMMVYDFICRELDFLHLACSQGGDTI